MSHEIDLTTGVPAMAYVGETPWHGLGKKLPVDTTIEEWQIAAGLNWEVDAIPVQYQVGDKLLTADNRFVLSRSDTNAALSVVSNRYKPVQPATILEFFRDLVEKEGFEIETAGSIYGGKKIWALAKTGQEARILGQDTIKPYLLLATSYDGTLPTTAKFTSVRVVCNNTMQFSLTDGERKVIIRHNTDFSQHTVKQGLGIDMLKGWDTYVEEVNALATRNLSEAEVKSFLIDTFGKPNLDDDAKQPNQQLMKLVYDAAKNSPGANLRSADGTAWGLMNGVTHVMDFTRKSRTNDARLNSAWFGNGEKFKAAAWENLMKLVA